MVIFDCQSYSITSKEFLIICEQKTHKGDPIVALKKQLEDKETALRDGTIFLNNFNLISYVPNFLLGTPDDISVCIAFC